MDKSQIEEIVKTLDVGKMRRYLYDVAVDVQDDIGDLLFHGHPGYIHMDSGEIMDEMVESLLLDGDPDSIEDTIEEVRNIENPIEED